MIWILSDKTSQIYFAERCSVRLVASSRHTRHSTRYYAEICRSSTEVDGACVGDESTPNLSYPYLASSSSTSHRFRMPSKGGRLEDPTTRWRMAGGGRIDWKRFSRLFLSRKHPAIRNFRQADKNRNYSTNSSACSFFCFWDVICHYFAS